MNKLTQMNLFGNVSSFAVIGSIGFLVDASLLKLYIVWVSNDPILGRLISFPIALTITWFLNRKYTFTSDEKKRMARHKEWGLYVLVNGIGGGINIAIFMLIVSFVGMVKEYPIIVLGMSSLIAMFYNYFGSKYWVFRV